MPRRRPPCVQALFLSDLCEWLDCVEVSSLIFRSCVAVKPPAQAAPPRKQRGSRLSLSLGGGPGSGPGSGPGGGPGGGVGGGPSSRDAAPKPSVSSNCGSVLIVIEVLPAVEDGVGRDTKPVGQLLALIEEEAKAGRLERAVPTSTICTRGLVRMYVRLGSVAAPHAAYGCSPSPAYGCQGK